MRAHPPRPPACPTSQVMSLCDETLEERMRRGALREPDAQLMACRELCEGLAYLHHLPEPIAHRDIKPANLLFRGSVLIRLNCHMKRSGPWRVYHATYKSDLVLPCAGCWQCRHSDRADPHVSCILNAHASNPGAQDC